MSRGPHTSSLQFPSGSGRSTVRFAFPLPGSRMEERQPHMKWVAVVEEEGTAAAEEGTTVTEEPRRQ